jgi:hypothetical protein
MTPGKWHRNIWLPGALMDLIPTRMEEVGETTLSRYLTELISYDLRERHAHSLTGWLSTLPLAVQQAIDLAIRCHYRPGYKSNKEQMARLIVRGFADALTGMRAEPLMAKARHEVYLRGLHRGIILERMAQLGFKHLSEYVISLIRFDLLVGGPHKHFDGTCSRPLAVVLDHKTADTYKNQPPKKCMVDYIIEEISGREMTPEERDGALRKISEQWVQEALAAQKKARKGA